MLKNEYIRMNERIGPSPVLQKLVMEKAVPQKTRRLRPVVAIAAALIMAVMAMPVMAAYVPAINQLMFQVTPEMAARFTPIQESCVKNGIRMEVVSTSIHGATAEVCVSFEDVEGDRIGANTRVEDDGWYGINPFLSGAMSSTTGNAAFHEEDGKLIYITEHHYSIYSEKQGRYLTVEEIYDGKMTVSVDELYRYTELPIVDIPIEMTDREVITVKVERGSPTDHVPEVPFDGFGCASSTVGDPWVHQQVEYDLLRPGEAVYELTDGLAVTGMAYIDGRLHIQTRLQRSDQEDAPAYNIWFVDAEGNETGWSNQNTFVIEHGENWGYYQEAIYDISVGELAELTLLCQIEEKEIMKGPWRVTFSITESDYVGAHDDGVPMTEAIVE